MELRDLPDIVTIKELATFLKISESTVNRAIAASKLKTFKVGRGVRIEKANVLEWLRDEQ